MKTKKVICYGASVGFERLYHAISALYNVVGVSDRNPEKSEIAKKYNITFYVPEELPEQEYDYIVITSCYSDSIKQFLMNNLGIDSQKIIGYYEFLEEQSLSLGEKNSDKEIYLLRRMDTSNGINILILEYLYHLMHCKQLDMYDVVIDAKNYTTIYHALEDSGKQDVLSYYFDKQDAVSIDETYQSKRVILSQAAMLNENVEKVTKMQRDICKDKKIRKQYRALYHTYFPVNAEMKRAIEEQVETYITPIHEQGKKICAVVDRSREYNYTKTYAHYKFPDAEFTFNKLCKLQEKWKFDYILLDTHNIKTEAWYREKFGDIILLTQRTRIDVEEAIKRQSKAGISENRKDDKYYQGKELLVSRYLLAQCDYFYSGISGSSTFPMLLDNQFIDTYIYENGRFGFEYEALNGLPVKDE